MSLYLSRRICQSLLREAVAIVVAIHALREPAVAAGTIESHRQQKAALVEDDIALSQRCVHSA